MDLTKLRGERVFDFVVTVPDVPDKDGERFPDGAALEEAFDLWLINGAPISLNHTNKFVGKGLRWWKDEYKGHEAYFARGLLNKNPVADEVWEGIQNGKYKDVSFGGFAMDPVTNNKGETDLNDSYLIEVAVCEDGIHPMSDIVDHNAVAKSGKVRFIAKACIVGVDKKNVPGFDPESDDEDPVVNVPVDIKKPFAGYSGFDDCVSKNQDKDDPKAYCAAIMQQVENTGGSVMTKKEVKKQAEEETEEKPKEEDPEEKEKVEGQYVSVEEFNQLKEIVAQIAERVKPVAVEDSKKSVPGTGEEGGEPSPDGTEDESEKEDGGSTPETDEGEAGKVTDENTDETPTDNTEVTKMVKAEVKKAVDKIAVKKAVTPRPGTVAKDNKPDAFKDIIKAEKPIDAASFRDGSREGLEADWKDLMKSARGVTR